MSGERYVLIYELEMFCRDLDDINAIQTRLENDSATSKDIRFLLHKRTQMILFSQIRTIGTTSQTFFKHTVSLPKRHGFTVIKKS